MGLIDAEIREAIFIELDELINKLEKDTADFEKDLSNKEYIKRIFRYVHTIKGSAGMLESEILTKLAHNFENLLGLIRDNKILIKKEMFPLFYDVHSVINKICKKLKNNEPVVINIANILNGIEKIIETGEITAEVAEAKADIVEDIKKEFVEEETIRVNLTKIDYLINLLGELHLTNRMYVKQFYNLKDIILNKGQYFNIKAAEFIVDQLEEQILKFNYLFDEFRDNLLGVRMVKVSNLFERFPKLVRALAKKFNKEVEINFEGMETKIDKRILEEASEPLLHIIRNAVDHGLESSQERMEKGKPVTGNIFVKTYPAGGDIIIEISDDGAGIDPFKIKQKLIQKKMFPEKEISLMTEKEIIDSIFIPGFSTKEDVNEISGRGVGMDIVAEKLRI